MVSGAMKRFGVWGGSWKLYGSNTTSVMQNVLRDLPKMKMQMGERKRYLKRRMLDKYIQ